MSAPKRFGPRNFLWTGLLAVLAGCPRGQTSPRHLTPGQISGRWTSVTRDRAAPRVYRIQRILWELNVNSESKRVEGTVEMQGALSSGYQGKLQCNRKVAAKVIRTARLGGRQITSKLVHWRLSRHLLKGEKKCGFRFPKLGLCVARPHPGRRLHVTCGAFKAVLSKATLTGIWTWQESRTDPAGDSLTFSQRYHLRQQGNRISGYVDHLQVHVSGDGQRYRCNGRLRYARQARHTVEGQLRGRTVTLKVQRTLAMRGPCQGQLALPSQLTGTWKPLENQLTLDYAGRDRVLWRQPAARRYSGKDQRP